MGKSILADGYGIMPNTVLFDPEISSSAKLMLCYISSLAASTGKCRPRNKHLADKFGISTRQVTRLLEEIGAYIYCGDDDQGRRYIALAPEFTTGEGGRQKSLGGTTKTSIHSNINSNDKYSVELIDQMKQIHKKYVLLFKIDPHTWQQAATDERRDILLKALHRYKLTDQRKAKLAARLNDGGFDMIMRALKNANDNAWNHGENDSNWKMDLYEYLLRNYEMVERWANQGGTE
jgi:hypothetical protein